MQPKSLSNRQLLEIVLGKRTAAKLPLGFLHPLVFGEHGQDPHPKLAAAYEIACRVLEEEMVRGPGLTSTSATRQYLKAHCRPMLYEVFICVFLDSQHRVICAEEIFRGTLDGSMVHPREIVRAVLKFNAGACIFAHNHPSGVAEPSQADISITRRLKSALELVGVRTLDHLIVGGEDVVSLAERGLV